MEMDGIMKVTDREKHFGDGWKICKECGHKFFVSDVDHWVYKRYVSENGISHMAYFCKWSCLRTFDKRYEAEKKKKHSEAATRGHKTRKARRNVSS